MRYYIIHRLLSGFVIFSRIKMYIVRFLNPKHLHIYSSLFQNVSNSYNNIIVRYYFGLAYCALKKKRKSIRKTRRVIFDWFRVILFILWTFTHRRIRGEINVNYTDVIIIAIGPSVRSCVSKRNGKKTKKKKTKTVHGK